MLKKRDFGERLFVPCRSCPYRRAGKGEEIKGWIMRSGTCLDVVSDQSKKIILKGAFRKGIYPNKTKVTITHLTKFNVT